MIFGELVPKQLALNKAEVIASKVARDHAFPFNCRKPLVIILSMFHRSRAQDTEDPEDHGPPVTEEEIKILLEEGTEAGVFEEAELSMIEGVLEIGDLRVESLMIHRSDIIALDLDDTVNENLQKMIISGRSYFLLTKGTWNIL